MKTQIFKKFLFVLMLSFFVLAHAQAAAGDYTTLVDSLPGVGATTNIGTYIPAMINIAITVGAVLAFVMITFGGIVYATSDAVTGKSQGKELVTNAIYGLLLILAAYAILFTINPDTVNIKLTIPKPNIGAATPGVVITPPGTPPPGGAMACPPCHYTEKTGPNGKYSVLDGYAMSQTQINSDKMNRSLLQGVTVNHGACLSGGVSGCTNLNDLGKAIEGVNWVAKDCGCGLEIQGGSEGGHSDHGPNKPVVDLDPAGMDAYFAKMKISNPRAKTQQITLSNGMRANVTYEAAGGNSNGSSTGAHYHVVFQ